MTGPLNPSFIRNSLPIIALVACTGCFRFSKPMVVPEGLESWPGIEALRSGQPTREAFQQAFPKIERFIMISRVRVSQRRLLGKALLDVSLRAGGPRTLRMAGRHPGDQTTIFDLLVNGESMSIHVPPNHSLYEGEIPPGGSPFRRQFGVEPWDLIPIVAIGQRVAAGDFQYVDGDCFVSIIPSALDTAPDGLKRLELDKATGLPREGFWERDGARWRVLYQAWDYADGPEGSGGRWIMPTRFTITRRRPRVRIEVRPRPEVRQYKIDIERDPSVYRLMIRAGTARLPLSEFEEALMGR